MAGGDDIPDFSDRDAVEAWLTDKPREWSVVLATRAALRAFPAVGKTAKKRGFRTTVLLPILRRNAIALAANAFSDSANGKVPYNVLASASKNAAELNPSSAAAAAAAAAVAVVAFFYAASASAIAAVNSTIDVAIGINRTKAADPAINAAEFAASAQASAAEAVAFAVSALAMSSSAFLASALATKVDAIALTSKMQPQEMVRLPLWYEVRSSIRPPARSWKILKNLMRADGAHWQVWVDWYEDVLAGRWRGEAHAAAFTDLPGELPWDKGPEAVNSEIARRLATIPDKASSNDERQPATPRPVAESSKPKKQKQPRQAKASKQPKTAVGRAVMERPDEIVAQALALECQIEGLVETLNKNKPNDPDRLKVHEELVLQLGEMTRQLFALRESVGKFVKDDESEKSLNDKALSFKQGFQNWWNARHVDFLTEVSAAGLLIGGCSLLVLAGAGSFVPLSALSGICLGKRAYEAIKELRSGHGKVTNAAKKHS